MAGRPKGSQNKDKPFREALRMELAKDRKALRAIARSLIATATAGDVQAAKEIRDTLDGKPAQSVEMSGALSISHEEALGELE